VSVLLAFLNLVVPISGADFNQCKSHVLALLDGTATNTSSFDIVYHGQLRGINPSRRNNSLALTSRGCVEACGTSPDLWDAFTIFQILTTWVLPSVSLLAQLPWESLSVHKRKNFEAFLNWVGSPAASLTTTIFNIHMIAKCKDISKSKPELTDTLYILSCINQYEYPGRRQSRPARLEGLDVGRRNAALLQGIYRKFMLEAEARTRVLERDEIDLLVRLDGLTATLAFHLRILRRRAVWPLAFNIIWFGVALVISIVTAFADLGDNSTAHSLALGLLLSWIPSLVVMAIVDRNPASSTRCQELIERWLYNIDKVVERQLREQNVRTAPQPPTTPSSLQPWNPMADMWNPAANKRPFGIGVFVGQGRYLRYCGVANTVLKRYSDSNGMPQNIQLNGSIENSLTTRPGSWWIIWGFGQAIVATSFGMAFMVSFNTPTIGLGCRSLLYMIWYLLTWVSWMTLGIKQEPPRWLQKVMILPNLAATILLALIMIFQVLGLLNNCLCKSSTFGLAGYGGYMDFEGALFYRSAYGIQKYWGTATAIGIAVSFATIGWAMRRWSKSSPLWRITESDIPQMGANMTLDWLR